MYFSPGILELVVHLIVQRFYRLVIRGRRQRDWHYHDMFILVELDKTYEASVLILLACTIPCAKFLVSIPIHVPRSKHGPCGGTILACPCHLHLSIATPAREQSHLVCDLDRIGHSQRSFGGHQLFQIAFVPWPPHPVPAAVQHHTKCQVSFVMAASSS
jgi:hypothetical protein